MRTRLASGLLLAVLATLPIAGMAADKPEQAPIKAICQFSGYSMKNYHMPKNTTPFGSDTMVVSSQYDFSSEIKKLPESWTGPKGKIYLGGTSSDPEPGWASFSLFFDYGTGNYAPANQGTDTTAVKLIPGTSFRIRKQVNKASTPTEVRWYVDVSCQLGS